MWIQREREREKGGGGGGCLEYKEMLLSTKRAITIEQIYLYNILCINPIYLHNGLNAIHLTSQHNTLPSHSRAITFSCRLANRSTTREYKNDVTSKKKFIWVSSCQRPTNIQKQDEFPVIMCYAMEEDLKVQLFKI